MNRLQIRLGFILILLGLLTGFAIPELANPRLGLAAHNVGMIGGLVLIVLGALARSLATGPRASAIMMWSWVYAAYANWFGCLLGAITGASRLTPIAGSETSGDPLSEAVVSFLLVSLAIASVIGTAIAVWGFRPAAVGTGVPDEGAQRT